MYGCMDWGRCSLLFLMFCSKPGFSNHSNVCGFFPIPLTAKLLSFYSWCRWPSPVSPGKQCWGGARGRAEPGLLPPCTSVMCFSCRCTVPAREGERKNNRKITGYLPRIPKLERGRELTAQNRNMYFGWARNVSAPSQHNHSPWLQCRHFCSPGSAPLC